MRERILRAAGQVRGRKTRIERVRRGGKADLVKSLTESGDAKRCGGVA
jgi:hypothetical protein